MVGTLGESRRSRILNPKIAERLMNTYLDYALFLRFLTKVAIAVAVCCLFAVGCTKSKIEDPGEEAAVEFVAPDPLTLLVVGDEQLGPRIKRQWAARQDGVITVVDLAAADFVSSDFELPDGVDVLIYPPSMLGDLVSRERLLEIPRDVWNGDEVKKNELLKHYRTLVVRHDNRNWAAVRFSVFFDGLQSPTV